MLPLIAYNKISECSRACTLYVLPIYYISNIDGFCHFFRINVITESFVLCAWCICKHFPTSTHELSVLVIHSLESYWFCSTLHNVHLVINSDIDVGFEALQDYMVLCWEGRTHLTGMFKIIIYQYSYYHLFRNFPSLNKSFRVWL
jgi:hypothetical protein